MTGPDSYIRLSHIVPWICVDLEINPDNDELQTAGVLYQLTGQDLVSHTFSGHEWKKLFDLLERLIKQDAVLIILESQALRPDLNPYINWFPSVSMSRNC